MMSLTMYPSVASFVAEVAAKRTGIYKHSVKEIGYPHQI